MKRSNWKGPFYNVKKKNVTKTIELSRNSFITPSLKNKLFSVHNGRKFIKLLITDEMIGHTIGEFVSTRESFEFKKKKKKNGSKN